MRINVEDLTEILDTSRSSLFGWRKGRRAVSPKAWRKLEAAEKAAGLGELSPKELAEDSGEEAEPLSPVEERLARIEKSMEEMGKLLREMKAAMEAPVELEKLEKRKLVGGRWSGDHPALLADESAWEYAAKSASEPGDREGE